MGVVKLSATQGRPACGTLGSELDSHVELFWFAHRELRHCHRHVHQGPDCSAATYLQAWCHSASWRLCTVSCLVPEDRADRSCVRANGAFCGVLMRWTAAAEGFQRDKFEGS